MGMHGVASVNPSSDPFPGPPAGLLAFEMLESKSDSLACPGDAESCRLPSLHHIIQGSSHLNSGDLRSDTGSDYAGLQKGVQLKT